MPRGKHRPAVGRRVDDLVQSLERRDRLRCERRLLTLLVLTQDGDRPDLEVDALPSEAVTPSVVRVGEDLGTAYARVREDRDERPVTDFFDSVRSFLVNRFASSLVDVINDRQALLDASELLVAAVRGRTRRHVVFRDLFLGGVLREVVVFDRPGKERRHLVVVGPRRRRRDAAVDVVGLASFDAPIKVGGVVPHRAFAHALECVDTTIVTPADPFLEYAVEILRDAGEDDIVREFYDRFEREECLESKVERLESELELLREQIE